MVGGCMPNKYWVKLYVKAHYMWYYIKHPKAWWQMKKIKNRNLRQLMNLYIGRLNMIDNEHDEINFKRLGVYGSILALTIWFWYSVFTNGLLVSVLWLVVLAGIIGICINMWNMRA